MSTAKELIRVYMRRRSQSRLPIPSQEEIRRRLGWHLKPASDKRKK